MMWQRNYGSAMLVLSSVKGVLLVLLSQVAGSLMPNFNTTSEHVTVTQGSRAILPCSVEFIGQQSVIWVNPKKILISHGDRRMMDDHRISVERPYIKEWNLLIRDVRHNDSGTYECRINTQPKQIKKVTLSVQVPPMIISEVSSDRVSLEEGDTATLICNVTGIPQPTVIWYKRNTRKIDGKRERIGTEGEVLVIHNVSRLCDDIYECAVDNGVPPAVSKAIRVTVDYPPEVTLPNKRIGQMQGKETILDCIISANPQAVTEWRRNGRALHKGPKYDIDVFRDEFENSVNLNLRIKHLELDDYGTYICVGSNHLGEDQEEMTLYEVIPTTTTTTTTTSTSTSTSDFRYHVETEKIAGPLSGRTNGQQRPAVGPGQSGTPNREGISAAANTGGESQQWNSWKQGGSGPRQGNKDDDSYRGKDNTWSVERPDDRSSINSSGPSGRQTASLHVPLASTLLAILLTVRCSHHSLNV